MRHANLNPGDVVVNTWLSLLKPLELASEQEQEQEQGREGEGEQGA